MSWAAEAAHAAQVFGQDDDITVLTLTRVDATEKPFADSVARCRNRLIRFCPASGLPVTWHTGAVNNHDGEESVPVRPVPSITTLSSREIYRNPWMVLREDEILRSNGKKGIYGVVEKDEAAIIIPIDGDRIWLVEQFRYTIQEQAVELPQGGWEMAEVDPEELARGELKEETGLHADTMTYLGQYWIAYGFTRQKQHVFLATGLTHSEKEPDEEEHDIIVRNMPVAEFEQMMLDGRVRDGCTLAAWALYLLWKARQ